MACKDVEGRQRAVGGVQPDSLLDVELAGERITRAPEPAAVTVWVRYRGEPVQVEADAVAWTSRAVMVVWEAQRGQRHRAWVWASAVQRKIS